MTPSGGCRDYKIVLGLEPVTWQVEVKSVDNRWKDTDAQRENLAQGNGRQGATG